MEKILLSASLAAILAACAACTVKEDRDVCPCSLTVSFSDPDASGPVELLAPKGNHVKIGVSFYLCLYKPEGVMGKQI